MEMVGVRKGDGKRIFPVTNALNLKKIQKRLHYKKHKGKTNHHHHLLFGAQKES